MCVRTSIRWRSLEEEEEEKRNPRITKESLRRMCKEQKLYITPDLNDVLYLHYKGYSKIENLEEYTGLKCLWLENNGIDKIENLDNQKDLRNLYLHNNLIKEIENLEDACPLLDSLNLCHNNVSKIQNLSKLEHLHTLQISHNRLQDFADVEHLRDCKELSCVDLQHNWLDDPSIVDIFEAMPSLRVLYLTGNPVVKKIPFYRKNLTVRCKKLTYLDDRPVFPKDRAAAEAWSEGGLEAEKACRQKWADEERAKIDASVKGLLALRDKAKAKKYRQEMEKLKSRTESEKEEEEQEEVGEEENGEEEEGEEEEERESGDESDFQNEHLNAGDSEEVTHNGIIFPWDLDRNVQSRNRSELGEGGRSLIVEIPDSNESEKKASKSVQRKSPNDPEMKNKLHKALLSTEWLQEKDLAGDKPEEKEDKTETKQILENPADETPLCDAQNLLEAKTFEEAHLEEEEIEKGTLDNLVKEKELAYQKYIAKTEEEILPNISHFAFGQEAAKKEKRSLGSEIEELLRIEKEEIKRAEMEKNVEKREEIRKKLIEEIEDIETLKETEVEKDTENEVVNDVPSQEIPKELVRAELENIIKRAINVFITKKTLIDEKEANEVLDNGVKVIDELNSIGKLPLKEKETDIEKISLPSSNDQIEDIKKSDLTLTEQFILVGEEGKNKLESQEPEDHYSLITEVIETENLQKNEVNDGKVDKAELEITDHDRCRQEAEKVQKRKNEHTESNDLEKNVEHKLGENKSYTADDENSKESCFSIHKKNITSSIELQIVTEAAEEKLTEEKRD